MADPLTLVGMGATALGAGVSAFGSMQQGAAQKQMYQYQAAVAEVNRKIALQNATYEIQVGGVEAQKSGLQSRYQIGQIKAGQGASNLDVNRGSAVDVQRSASEVAQQNQGIIRANAARRAYGFEVDAAAATAQGQVMSMAASRAQTSGDIGAISSILGGAASVSSKWLQAQSVFGDRGLLI